MGLFIFLGALILLPFAGAAVYRNRKREDRPPFRIQLVAGAIALALGGPAVVCVLQGLLGVFGVFYSGRSDMAGRGLGLLAAGVCLGYFAWWLVHWVERNFADKADQDLSENTGPE
jgi:hypothetical protein